MGLYASRAFLCLFINTRGFLYGFCVSVSVG